MERALRASADNGAAVFVERLFIRIYDGFFIFFFTVLLRRWSCPGTPGYSPRAPPAAAEPVAVEHEALVTPVVDLDNEAPLGARRRRWHHAPTHSARLAKAISTRARP